MDQGFSGPDLGILHEILLPVQTAGVCSNLVHCLYAYMHGGASYNFTLLYWNFRQP